MPNLIGTPEEIAQHIFAAKAKLRQEQANLPYEEKLRILLKLQRIQDEFRALRGEPPKAWPMSLVEGSLVDGDEP